MRIGPPATAGGSDSRASPGVIGQRCLVAQNCAGATTGKVPLTDLGTGSYQGFPGGLYPAGLNTMPASHAAAGLQQAQAVQPLDAAGQPNAAGRIVLVSIGMSNTTQEFSTWVPISNADPQRNFQFALKFRF